MMRKLIHCEESIKNDFDNYTTDQVREMIGFYEPDEGKWEVTMLEEGVKFTVDTQFEAESIASHEMIKAMIMNQSTQKPKSKEE